LLQNWLTLACIAFWKNEQPVLKKIVHSFKNTVWNNDFGSNEFFCYTTLKNVTQKYVSNIFSIFKATLIYALLTSLLYFFRFFKFYFWSKSLHFVRSKQVFLKPWKLTTFLLRSFIFRCPKNLGNKEDSTLKYFFFCKKMSILFAFRMLATSFRNSNVYSQLHLRRKNV